MCSKENLLFAEHIIHQFALSGWKVAVNEKFQATKPTTVTSASQALGILAIQIELAPQWRPPVASVDNLRKTARILLPALTLDP